MSLKFKVGSGVSHVPEGEYKATVEKVTKSHKFKRPSLVFVFRIIEGQYKGSKVHGFCNADYEVFSERTKLYHWYCVATREEFLTADMEIDMDDFLDKVFVVQIRSKPSQTTKNIFSNAEIKTLVSNL